MNQSYNVDIANIIFKRIHITGNRDDYISLSVLIQLVQKELPKQPNALPLFYPHEITKAIKNDDRFQDCKITSFAGERIITGAVFNTLE